MKPFVFNHIATKVGEDCAYLIEQYLISARKWDCLKIIPSITYFLHYKIVEIVYYPSLQGKLVPRGNLDRIIGQYKWGFQRVYLFSYEEPSTRLWRLEAPYAELINHYNGKSIRVPIDLTQFLKILNL